MDKAYKNTDRELWREREGDYYADSIFVTEQGAIGINHGGYVRVMPLSGWFEAAGGKFPALPEPSSSSATAPHAHTDECWEPDSGCDMGRNAEFARTLSLSDALEGIAEAVASPPTGVTVS